MRARGREYKHADSGARMGARVRSGGAHRAAERAANAHACGHKHERENMSIDMGVCTHTLMHMT